MSKRTAKKVADFVTTVQRDNGLTNKQIADAFGFPPGYMSILRNDPDNLPEKTIGILEEWMLSGLTLEEYQMSNVADGELPPPKIPAEDTSATPVVREEAVPAPVEKKAKKERKLKLKTIEVEKKKSNHHGPIAGTKKWITNGVRHECVDINMVIPEGYWIGRLKKRANEVLNIISQDDPKYFDNVAKAAEEQSVLQECSDEDILSEAYRLNEVNPSFKTEEICRLTATHLHCSLERAEKIIKDAVNRVNAMYKKREIPFINTPDTPHEAVDREKNPPITKITHSDIFDCLNNIFTPELSPSEIILLASLKLDIPRWIIEVIIQHYGWTWGSSGLQSLFNESIPVDETGKPNSASYFKTDCPEMTPEQMRKMLDSQPMRMVYVPKEYPDIHQKIILEIEIRVTVKQ